MKISNIYFYKSHKKEISKYLHKDSAYVNIFHSDSNIPDGLFENVIKINSKSDLEGLLKTHTKAKKLDLIVLSDIFELTDDIYIMLKTLAKFLKNDGILILSSINPLWNILIRILNILRLKNIQIVVSYIKPKKIVNILNAGGFNKVKNYSRIYFPFKFFGIGDLINFIFYIMFPFLNFGIRNYLVFNPSRIEIKRLSKSIIIPAKNEEGNLEELIQRIPEFDEKYELIIVCGESRDNTYSKSLEIKEEYSHKNISVYKQSKNGKANAVWEGLEKCNNELVAILDSDLSVDPETLNDFFEIIESGNADFVNGTRLIYQMEIGAMKNLNKIGNRIFQFLISKLTSVNLTDSLCGTKVFKLNNANFIYLWQQKMYFQDPFCDFDLIFSTAYSSKRIVEYPVYYRSRTYGSTNISRFRDGWKLLFYFFNSYVLFKSDFSPKKLLKQSTY